MMPGLSSYSAIARQNLAPAQESLAGIGGRPPRDEARARETAQNFETMVLEDMLGRVFEAAGEGGFFGEAGPGSSIYRSMLVKEYAGMIAQSGGIGLADQVYAEILKLQEGA